MADRKLQKLIRAFSAGDTSVGAALAAEMLRARAILSAVASLAPDLQATLASQTISEGLRDEIQEALAEGIDPADIAAEIDTSDVASEIEIDTYTLSESIDYSSLGYEIDYSDLSSEIDYDDLSREIDYSDLAQSVDAEEIAGHFDMDELASLVAAKLEDRLAEMVEEATG